MTCVSRRDAAKIFASVAGLGWVAAPLSRARAEGPVAMTAAYGQTSLYNAPMWIAKEQGLFEKYGLKADLVQLPGSRITQGLLADSAQFIAGSASSSFIANLGGGDCLLIGSTLNKLPWDLVGTSKIESKADLKGKTGALALRGDFTEVALRLAMKSAGLDASKDAALVQGFGTDADRIAALAGGSADFSVVNSDFRKQYESAGLHRIFSMMDIQEEFVLSGIFTTKHFAKQSPEVVTNYLKAIGEALHLMVTNQKLTVDITAKYSKRSPEDVAPSYEAYKNYMQVVPVVTRQLVESSLRALAPSDPRAAAANPDDFFDASYMDKLKASGFFDSLK